MRIKVFDSISTTKSFRQRGESSQRFYPLNLFDKVDITKQDDKLLIEMFNTVPEIAAIVKYIAQVSSKIPYKIVKYLANGKEKEIQLPDIENVLDNPNQYQNGTEFTRLNIIYFLLLGDVFINKYMPIGFKNAKRLYSLPPQFTSIIFEQMLSGGIVDPNADFRTNEIRYYQLKYGSSFKLNFEPKEIIHYKDSNANFLNGEYAKGFSRVHSAIMATKAIKAGYEAKYSFYKNRGAMGILTNRNENGVLIDDEEKLNILETFKKHYGLRENQNLFNITEANLDYINISPDFSGLLINENNEADFRALCKAIGGFPSVLLNDNRTATYNNLKEAQKTLYTNIIIPLLSDYYETLTNGFNLDSEGIYLLPDFSKIEALQADKKDKEQANLYLNNWSGKMYNDGAITLNEYRELNGFEKVNDGDRVKNEQNNTQNANTEQ